MPGNELTVSCIMPTRNRRPFVSQAIRYYLRQDYPFKELVIIDDGNDAIADLVPKDDHIRYIRLEEPATLGTKRNLACELSQGDLIAHWDDDDWIAPDRLSFQVKQLLDAGADVCGALDLLHYLLNEGQAWFHRRTSDKVAGLAGGTLLYRRSVWQSHRFPEVNSGADVTFIKQISPDKVHTVSDSSFYIAVIHPGNNSARNLNDVGWQQRPLDEVTNRLFSDRDFYVALRYGRTQESSSLARKVPEPITVAAPFLVYDGYGSIAEYLVLGLVRSGAKVNVVPFRLDLNGLTLEFKKILRLSRPEPRSPALIYAWPRENFGAFKSSRDLFIYTMWETSQLPVGWGGAVNAARAVIVPSQFVAEVFSNSGVSVPIEVVPHGVDPDVYHYESRPERPGLTTLIVGTLVPRKNIDEGIAAWKLAFAGDPDARLVIKTRFKLRRYVPDDPRIRCVDTEETTHGIAHWYREADVLLALGNEGFGLPLIEGMATGLPVIALDSEGQADVCQYARGRLLTVSPARWERFDEAPFGPCGVRGIPDVQEIAERLRWVATKRDAAREMGRAASEWTLEHRNIWSMSPAILDVMERYTQPPRPLRRIRTLKETASAGRPSAS